MSDYLAVEHNAETGEETSRPLTQDEIDVINALTFTLGETVENETTSALPFEPVEPNPLPEDTEL
jgi:uncharacterized metal-binding protein YceD (DUF177 family)